MDVLHEPADEFRMIDRCCAAGAMDGALARLVPMVDGTSNPVQGAMVTILREIVGNSLKTFQRGF
jgi:hypothetical protein